MDESEMGYMKAIVEQNTREITRLTKLLEEHSKNSEHTTEEIKVYMRQLRDELNTYKTVIRLVKLLGATAILILTFKFGDISELWRN